MFNYEVITIRTTTTFPLKCLVLMYIVLRNTGTLIRLFLFPFCFQRPYLMFVLFGFLFLATLKKNLKIYIKLLDYTLQIYVIISWTTSYFSSLFSLFLKTKISVRCAITDEFPLIWWYHLVPFLIGCRCRGPRCEWEGCGAPQASKQHRNKAL